MSNKFTYKASEYITNPTFRANWLDAVSQNRVKVIIDGVEIPSYSEYTYVDVKSYFKEPERSAKGVINNLNSYATFLTPKLRFSFNSMPIAAYRTLMRLIKERNEFTVQVYDPVEDEVVVRKMYFSPKDYPELFTKGYEVLRANNEEFELIGTNADLNTYSLIYNNNVTSTSGGSTSNQTTGLTFFYGQEITIGDYDSDVGIDPTSEQFLSNAGFTFVNWNTASDGSGDTFLTGQSGIQFTSNKTLYAMWKSQTEYTVSFDYQGGSGETTTSKTVIQGEAYGTLPSQVFRNGYIFGGWYTQTDGQGTQITEDTIFNKTYNETLYAYWIGATATVTFNANGGSGSMNSITSYTGATVDLPANTTITRNGYQFMGWSKTAPVDKEGEEVAIEVDIEDAGKLVVPAGGITLYAVWQQAYLLTYYVNNNANTTYRFNVALEKTPPYVSRVEDNGDGTFTTYTLMGWYTDPNFAGGTMAQFPLEITENTNLYARWEANE